jgi:hypothetical protein
LLRFFLNDQIVEINISIETARCETHIILPPIDASYFIHVALALEVSGAILSVKVIDVDGIQSNSASKQMTAIAEFDFSALFNLKSS